MIGNACLVFEWSYRCQHASAFSDRSAASQEGGDEDDGSDNYGECGGYAKV